MFITPPPDVNHLRAMHISPQGHGHHLPVYIVPAGGVRREGTAGNRAWQSTMRVRIRRASELHDTVVLRPGPLGRPLSLLEDQLDAETTAC